MKSSDVPGPLSEADEDYTKETCYGDPILAIYNGAKGRVYAVVHRARMNDYMLACGYNTEDGTWANGLYGYKSEAQLMREEQDLFKGARKIIPQ